MTRREIKKENDLRKNLHYNALWEILGGSDTISPSTLNVSLRRWEKKLNYHNEVLCEKESAYHEYEVERIENAIKQYFIKHFAKGKYFVSHNLMFNHDQRGYAIKMVWGNRKRHLKPNRHIHVDWGYYGILAPEPDSFFY